MIDWSGGMAVSFGRGLVWLVDRLVVWLGRRVLWLDRLVVWVDR